MSCFLFMQRSNSVNHPQNTGTSGRLEECFHSIWGRKWISLHQWLFLFVFLSLCESLCYIFSPRQSCGSLFPLSTSKQKLKSTCSFLQTAQRLSRACCRNTPSHTSMSLIWKHSCAVSLLLFTCMVVSGCYWPTPKSWLKCKRGTTPLTRGAAPLSTRDITVWRMYAFHLHNFITFSLIVGHWNVRILMDILLL